MGKLNPTIGALLALIIAMPGEKSAFAQDAIDEIVVTATKRERSIQEVNIAMNAFNADAIADFGWNDITQIASQAPNVEIKYVWGNSMPVYTIRGIGMNSWQNSDAPSVGLFIDDIYQTSIATMGAQLYDMERVEVLKGPQGAIFGRNTTGGAVSYISRRPSQEFDAFLRADIGSYKRFEIEGATGGSLSETVSARLSFLTMQQGEGHITNRTTGDDNGEVNIAASRLQLLWEPDESTAVLAKVFWSRDRSEPTYYSHIGFFTPGYVAGTSTVKHCASWLNTRIPDPTECVDTFGYSDPDGDPYAGDYSHRPDTVVHDDATLLNDNIGGTLTVTHDTGNLIFTSLTSAQAYDRFQPKESDAIEILFVDFLFAGKIRSFSQEFRLVSNNDSGFNWLAGALYSVDSAAEDPPRLLYADDWIGLRGSVVYDQDRTSYSAYAQGEWELNDQWRLTLGGRYINESVEFAGEVAFLVGANFDIPLIQTFLPNPTTGEDGILDETASIGRVAIDYMPTDELLIYGSFATGYKGGGFNAGFITNQAAQVPFYPEEIRAFELGFKSTLQNGRTTINAAAFNYDYDNLQATTSKLNPVSGLAYTYIGNLATAEVFGMELELHWLPTDNIEMKLGTAYLDTRNTDPDSSFDGTVGGAERRLANSPENTFNAAIAYEVPYGSGWRMRLFTDYNWMGKHYKEIVNNTSVLAQSMWNARATWIAPDERYSLSWWIKNLGNEEWIVDTLSEPKNFGWGVYVYGMPRTSGLSFTYNFGN